MGMWYISSVWSLVLLSFMMPVKNKFIVLIHKPLLNLCRQIFAHVNFVAFRILPFRPQLDYDSLLAASFTRNRIPSITNPTPFRPLDLANRVWLARPLLHVCKCF